MFFNLRRLKSEKGLKRMVRVIAFIVEILVFICTCWIVFFLSFLVHELGHAVAYMAKTGDTHWHIRIGSGKSILKTQRLSIKLAVFDGECIFDKGKIKSTADAIVSLLGGPLFSFLTLGILLGIRLKFGAFESEIIATSAIVSIYNLSIFANTSILITTLAPIRYFWGETKGRKTDGLQILHIIRSKRS